METRNRISVWAALVGSTLADIYGLMPEPIGDPPPWAKKQYGHAKNHRVGGDTKASKRNSPRFERTNFGTMRRKR